MAKRILVIDDEADIVELIKAELEASHYEVTAAYDGESGLGKAFKEMPDLILLDIMMPKKSGYDVLSQLRNNEKTRNLPVIILSAKGETRSILESQNLGVTDYLIKPFEAQELLAYIRRYAGV